MQATARRSAGCCGDRLASSPTWLLTGLKVSDMEDAAIEVKDIRRFGADTESVAVVFLGETAIFVLAEEAVLLVPPDGVEVRIAVHDGVVLSAAADGRRLLTSGDDGRIVSIESTGKTERLVVDARRRWIDHVAAGRNGSIAWSLGKEAFWRSSDGAQTCIQLPSSCGGLAFAPDDTAVAVAHYNGATLWRPGEPSSPRELASKGMHLQPSFSRDGKILLTAMREPNLHAWSIADGTDLPTPIYRTAIRSMDWTTEGRFLATSGGHSLTLLSFKINEDPLARMPLLFAPHRELVAAVACHPRKDIIAVGYEDGLLLLVRFPDGAEIVLKRPNANEVTALRWSNSGEHLAIGLDNGQCSIITFDAL